MKPCMTCGESSSFQRTCNGHETRRRKRTSQPGVKHLHVRRGYMPKDWKPGYEKTCSFSPLKGHHGLTSSKGWERHDYFSQITKASRSGSREHKDFDFERHRTMAVVCSVCCRNSTPETQHHSQRGFGVR